MQIPREVVDTLCAAIRSTIQEFGKNILKDAVIIGPYEATSVSDIKYLYCPTIASHTLGNTSFEVARFFEDIL